MIWQIILKVLNHILSCRLRMHFHISTPTLGGDSPDQSLATSANLIEVTVHRVILWPPDLHLLLPQMHRGLVKVDHLPFSTKPVDVLSHEILLLPQLLSHGASVVKMVLGGEKADAKLPVVIRESILVDLDAPIVHEPRTPLLQTVVLQLI